MEYEYGIGVRVRNWSTSTGLECEYGIGVRVRDWSTSTGLEYEYGIGVRVRDCASTGLEYEYDHRTATSGQRRPVIPRHVTTGTCAARCVPAHLLPFIKGIVCKC